MKILIDIPVIHGTETVELRFPGKQRVHLTVEEYASIQAETPVPKVTISMPGHNTLKQSEVTPGQPAVVIRNP